jgi:hypothetical protein
MIKNDQDLRAPWLGSLLFIAAFAASCASGVKTPEPLAVDDYTDALSQDQFDCERTKRECLSAAACAADKREACETAFRSCEEPVRAERDKLHETCRTARESCEAAAVDETARHACHMQEHRCTLPVEPPEAVCRVDAEECIGKAHGMTMPQPTMPPQMSDAEKVCHETERACRDEKRLDPKDLPEAPHCGPGMMPPPPPPPACTPVEPAAPTTPTTAPAAMTQDHFACEKTKRECLIAADCAADKRAACEAAFRSCDEPFRTEKERVHAQCRAARESCEAAASDEVGRHACHMQEHTCNLPVEPPEAVCHIDAEECIWTANGMHKPEPMMPPQMSDAEQACHETEHTCVEAKRMQPEALPEPPHCEPPAPPPCKPVAPKTM